MEDEHIEELSPPEKEKENKQSETPLVENTVANTDDTSTLNTSTPLQINVMKQAPLDIKEQITIRLAEIKKYASLESSPSSSYSSANLWSAPSKDKCTLGWSKWSASKLSNIEKRTIYYNVKLTILQDTAATVLFRPVYNKCIDNTLIVPNLEAQITSVIKRNINLLVSNILIYSNYDEEVMNFKHSDIFSFLFYYISLQISNIIEDIINDCFIKLQNTTNK